MRRFQTILVAALAAGWAGTASAQGPGARQAAAPQTVQAQPAPTTPEQPADATRDELSRILEQYPPSVAMVLRLDPTLLSSREYLAMYPALDAFVGRHPEIAHNPGFFFGNVGGRGLNVIGGPSSSREAAFRSIEGVFEGLWVLIGIATFLSLMAWLAKNLIDHRRWLRISKIQTEVHSKLLDRLTSSEDLLAYIQSPSGRQFLDAAPAPAAAASPRTAISAPVNRILWSVQAGVVLALLGAGLWYARAQVSLDEIAQPLGVLGILSMFLGIGFALSAAIAYVVSRMLGLFEPAHQPHA